MVDLDFRHKNRQQMLDWHLKMIWWPVPPSKSQIWIGETQSFWHFKCFHKIEGRGKLTVPELLARIWNGQFQYQLDTNSCWYWNWKTVPVSIPTVPIVLAVYSWSRNRIKLKKCYIILTFSFEKITKIRNSKTSEYLLMSFKSIKF